MYVTTFEVTSKYPFPLDMLRYDGCHPAGSDDAATIGYSFDPQERVRDRAPYRVKLIAYHERRFWEPTAARWSSFMWSVVRDSTTTRKCGT